MCGKQSTTTQATTPPAQVMQQYGQVAGMANQVAQLPYQAYTGQMVAPVDPLQYQGIGGINQYANTAQPSYAAAQGVLPAAYGAIANASQPLTQGEIMNYYSPYQSAVIQATQNQFQQQNAIQQQQVLGNAATQGALGGDRSGIAQAVLAGQQQTAEAPVIAGLENTGYGQAVNLAMQQYQQNPMAAQYAIGNLANEYANLGAGAQAAGLQGAGAQVGAGTLEQTTQQAQDVASQTAYWQQQGYPFQVAQWLAQTTLGFAGTQGQTTTTQQPAPIFSDERLKEDISKVGETKDGQPLYRFRYRGHPQFHIGLIAQDVEKEHPEAVADMGSGYKGVDVKGATDSSVRKGYQFGGSPMGVGAPGAPGGPLDPSLSQAPYGLGRALTPPQSMGGQMAQLKPPPLPDKQPSMFDQAKQMADTAETGSKLASGAQKAYGWGQDTLQSMFPGPTASEAADLGTGFGMGADATAAAAGTADVAAASADLLPLMLLAQGGGRINYPGGLALPNRNRIQLPMRGGMGMPSFVRPHGYQGGGTPDIGEELLNLGVAQEAYRPVQTTSVPASQVPGDLISGDVSTSEQGVMPDSSGDLPGRVPTAYEVPANRGQPLAYAPGTPAAGGTYAPPSGVGGYQLPPRLPPSQRPQLVSGEGMDIGGMHISPEAGMAILSGLAGMLGSGATTLGGALGAGALTGIKSYTGLKQSEADIEMKARSLDQAAQNESDRITNEQQTQSLAQQREQREAMTPHLLGQRTIYSPEGYPMRSESVYGTFDPRRRIWIDAMGKPIDLSSLNVEGQTSSQPAPQQPKWGRQGQIPYGPNIPQIPLPPGMQGGGVPSDTAPSWMSSVSPDSASPPLNRELGEQPQKSVQVASSDDFAPSMGPAQFAPPDVAKNTLVGNQDMASGLRSVYAADQGSTEGLDREALENLKNSPMVKNNPGLLNRTIAVAQGRSPIPPTGRAVMSGGIPNPNQFIANGAYALNPGLDQTTFSRRQRTENFYAVGTQGGGGQNIVALNRWLAHSGNLLSIAEKMGMGDYTTFNDFKIAMANRGLWTKELQDQLGAWEVNRQGVAGEGAKVFAGSNSAYADRDEWNKIWSPDTPLHTIRSKLATAAEMGEQALGANIANYNEGMRTNHDPREFLTPHNRLIIDALKQGAPVSSLGAPSGAAPGQANVPPAAIEHLKSNPGLRGDFDAKYGTGSAARVLGQ